MAANYIFIHTRGVFNSFLKFSNLWVGSSILCPLCTVPLVLSKIVVCVQAGIVVDKTVHRAPVVIFVEILPGSIIINPLIMWSTQACVTPQFLSGSTMLFLILASSVIANDPVGGIFRLNTCADNVSHAGNICLLAFASISLCVLIQLQCCVNNTVPTGAAAGVVIFEQDARRSNCHQYCLRRCRPLHSKLSRAKFWLPRLGCQF